MILAANPGTLIPGIDTGSVSFVNLGEIIQTFLRGFMIIAGLAAFVFLLIGGFQYLTSGGDKVAAQNARERITYAITGLVIIVAAVAITQILAAVFGINILGDIKWPGPANTTVGAP
ncbi:MAG: pilin [Patescibacteria group bacterium]|nr:pilin [Patescibacteria group bacterium]